MTIHGFDLVREERVAEINALARIYRHAKSGARLLSLENDDENKVFTIAFATPPEDSTGLPHILEHSVLGGSRKYRLKDPFKELMKGSLKTFLNAFTYPDKTMYPVASQNRQDFYNLIDVYLDSVFHPLLERQTLQQEGWHHELASLDAPLTYKGVVFNEMKGNYSSPDSMIGEYGQRSIFPDTVYSLDSGGDPAAIPDLTHEQFTAFHRRYYHPSNCFIVLYGDDHSDERLRILDECLRDFDAAEPAAPIGMQPVLPGERRFVHGYDAGDAGPGERKSYLTLNWLLHDTLNVDQNMAMEILAHALIGTQASPLRKALIDSGLGDDLTGGGFQDYFRQGVFSTGLKGIAAADADKVAELILATLVDLAKQGIDPEMIKASLNTIEFRLRELNFGGYPRGLVLAIQAVMPWQQGGDPLSGIAFEAPLSHVKASYAAEPRFFERLIETALLNNPHRTRVLLQPDPTFAQQVEQAETERLARERSAMSEAGLQGVMESMQELERRQTAPDSPEALASIPSLSLADLDRQVKTIPISVESIHDAPVIYHDLFTNGITYVDVGFDLHALPQRLLPYAGLLGDLWLGMGTQSMDYVRMSQRIGQRTGGIGAAAVTTAVRNAGQAATWLFLRGKATVAETPALFDILHDITTGVRLDDRERFRQIVLASRSDLESGLLPSGHSYVSSRLRSHFGEADWVSEQMGGVSHLFFLRTLAERIDQDWPGVLADLQAVQDSLVNRGAMLCNITVDKAGYAAVSGSLAGFIASLPSRQRAVHRLAGRARPDAGRADHSGPGQLRRQGREPLRLRLSFRRRRAGRAQRTAHQLAVGKSAHAGRSLWRLCPVR